jgi:hypothetical protein
MYDSTGTKGEVPKKRLKLPLMCKDLLIIYIFYELVHIEIVKTSIAA